jgi:hypothetical protein
LTILTGSWTADALKGEPLFSQWVPSLSKHGALTAIGSLLVFVISFLLLFRYRKDFLAVRGISQHLCDPHSCLIVLLSSPNIVLTDITFPLTIDLKGQKVTLSGNSLDGDIKTLENIKKTTEKFWNWEQLLRGIEKHQEMLKHVYLIGSKATKKIPASFDFLDRAEKLITQYCSNVKIYKAPSPIGFENFDELVKGIIVAIKEIKKADVSEKDIIIDVTGGQKTTSIAGASVTLNSNVTFQYVQTDDPWDVLAYDVTIQSPVSF